MEKIMKCFIAIIFIAALCLTFYYAGKVSVYNAQKEYYQKTEALMDSLYEHNMVYMDSVMQTDTYNEYDEAKASLKKHYYMQR